MRSILHKDFGYDCLCVCENFNLCEHTGAHDTDVVQNFPPLIIAVTYIWKRDTFMQLT